jgi:hypothetical protein
MGECLSPVFRDGPNPRRLTVYSFLFGLSCVDQRKSVCLAVGAGPAASCAVGPELRSEHQPGNGIQYDRDRFARRSHGSLTAWANACSTATRHARPR